MLNKKRKLYKFLMADMIIVTILLGISYISTRSFGIGITAIITAIAFFVIMLCYIMESKMSK